jgi:signal transduction histidine kinase
VFIWESESRKWVVGVARGFKEESLKSLTLDYAEGTLGQVAVSGKPVSVTDTENDNNWMRERQIIFQTFMSENIRSFMDIPIFIGEEIYGIFTVAFTHPFGFNEDTQRLFLALSQRAGLSIENASLFEQTREIAVIEERARLARDLHDSAKQKAFAALAQLGASRGIFRKSPDSATEHLEEAENLVYEVIQELTFLIQEMYPLALKEKGLVVILREYIYEWETRNEIAVHLEVENSQRLPLDIEQALYRIIQESLANIARHSQASQVKINLQFGIEMVVVSVQDNGKGFDTVERPMGIGLRSMKERVAKIDGTLTIQSKPGGGTLIHVVTPVNLKTRIKK